ncbi:hypothetical protein RI367_005199 [Sorochytrium milnesiophthora]
MLATATAADTAGLATVSHQFKVKSYNSPTNCDHCGKLLWGVMRQGVSCQRCGYNSHFRCREHIDGPCGDSFSTHQQQQQQQQHQQPPSSPSFSLKRRSRSRGRRAEDEQQQQQHSFAAAIQHALPIPPETLALVQKSQLQQQLHQTPDAHIITPEGQQLAVTQPATQQQRLQEQDSRRKRKNIGEYVNDIIASTSVHAAAMEKKTREPSLNLLTTTPKNMTRFMARVGPLHAIELHVRDILSWKNKTKTCLALSVFTIYALYPVLLVITPQLALIYYIAERYYDQTRAQVLGGKKGGKLVRPAAATAAGAAAPAKFNTDASPSLKPSDLKDNMQFIQNLMGVHCDTYDTAVLFSRQYLSWASPQDTKTLLQLLIASLLPTLLAFYFVPLNHLVLLGGWAVFLGNTPLVLGIKDTLQPVLLEILNENWEFAKGVVKRWPEVMRVTSGSNTKRTATDSSLSEATSPGSADEGVYMVAIYENQRWWLGLGFINYLLSSERQPWTDYTGSIPLPPKASYTPPPGFSFLDNDWHVDHAWSVVRPDADGWVYSDHMWNNARSDAGVGSLTRRRKWVRRVLRRASVDLTAIEQQAIDAPSAAAPASAPAPAPSVAPASAPTAAPAPASTPAPVEQLPQDQAQQVPAADAFVAVPAPAAPPAFSAPPPPISPGVSVRSSTSRRSSLANLTSDSHNLDLENTSLSQLGHLPNHPNGGDGDDDVEYILEVDGEEVVLEGVRSLDMIDMDRLRDMVRSLKRAQNGGSGRSSVSSSVASSRASMDRPKINMAGVAGNSNGAEMVNRVEE